MIYSKKRILCIILSFLFAVYLYKKREILLTVASVLLYAAAITVLLTPICRRLEEKGIGNTSASIVSILLLLIITFFILSIFVPYLTSSTASFIKKSMPILISTAENMSAVLNLVGIDNRYYSEFADHLGKAVTKLTASAARWGISAAAQTGRIGFSIVLAYYFLRERSLLVRYLLLCVPLRLRKTVLCALNGCKNTALGYLSGIIKTSVFISSATFCILYFLRIPDAFLLSLFMGLFEILPYAGPIIALIPIIISAVPLGVHTVVLVFVLILIIQQIESNIVSPYFTASSTALHPLTAIMAVFLFGSLFGVWGILFAIPVIAMIKSIFWSFKQASII